MIIGVVKEIKSEENRVGLVPASVNELVHAGASVLVEQGAGNGIGISDEAYVVAGATIVNTAEAVFSKADLIVKVKEPQPEECRRLRCGQTLFTYLHLAADPAQVHLLQQSGVTAIAYETVTGHGGGLPLLAPMSQVAGRMSIQAGAHCLEMAQGGRGMLLGGVPGVAAANVVIIGAGVVGTEAVHIAVGMGARVTVLDTSLPALTRLDARFGNTITTRYATREALESCLGYADLVIGAVLVPGAAAPKLVTRAMLKVLRKGAVLVDVAIDQGGCFETSRPTTHREPTFVEEGIVHYCVTNMPGSVPRTSTFALNNATLPFILKLVTYGVKEALLHDPHFLNGLNVHAGQITCEAVALAMNQSCTLARDALQSE